MASTSTQPTSGDPLYLPTLPEPQGADFENAILDAYKTAAAKVVSEAVGVDLQKAYEGIDTGKKQADLYIAMARFRLGGKPDQWAQKVVDHFKADEYLARCTFDKGFVSFFINYDTFVRQVLRQVRLASPSTSLGTSAKPLDKNASKAGYGSNKSGRGKTCVVDFSSPNIAKPFHAGHLRSTIIGAFVTNLYEANGWDVVRINYLGDWGKQFGLLAVGFERYGNEEDLERDAIRHLFHVYVKVNEEGAKDSSIHDEARAFFKKMEDGDEGALAIWSRFRDFSIKKLVDTYKRLNIQFDTYNGEASVKMEKMEEAFKLLEAKDLLVEERGSLLCNLEPYKLGKVVVRKADGTSIYITRDLGGAAQRYDLYKFDKMIYVVAAQQDLHFKQVFKMLELMGHEWADRLEHVNFGLVAGMSTRKGTVKFLDEILSEAKDSMHEQMAKNEEKYNAIEDPEYTSDVVGQTAVKIQDMQARRINDYTFDIKRMTSFEGDTGPYIQYSHVRLCSVERKNPNVVLPEDLSLIKTELITEPKALEIIYLLASYPQLVRDAMRDYQPSSIVTYMFKLTHAVSSAWEFLKVQGEEEDLARARLYLFICTRDVLASAMRLLSLTPLDRM